ncbi:MAG: hypothetical protein ACTHN5_09495 [Phycisphaerae bacterium]
MLSVSARFQAQRSIWHEVAAVLSFSMAVALFIGALTPRISPPASPYASDQDLLWIAPLWVAIQLGLGLTGLRCARRSCNLAALVGVVVPILLEFVALIANWQEFKVYWHIP